MRRIYFDYQATTPLDPRVLDAMMPYMTERFGNAASRGHAYGWEAEEAVNHVRNILARTLNAHEREILFTSGATESINLALLGVAEGETGRGKHLITTAIEHPATLEPCKYLESQGWRITYLPVDRQGLLDPATLQAALTPETALISVMQGNNEVGTLQPISEIGRIAKRHGALFHVDAAQSFGKLAIDVQEVGIDLLSLSGHKMYGPKGIGALYVRRRDPRVRLAPRVLGGGQERGLRAGTLNVPAIVGLGKAVELAIAELETESARQTLLRTRFWAMLQNALPAIRLNGHPDFRLPGNLHVTFDGVRADDMLTAMKGVAAATGSACASATQTPSHVLRAMGFGEDDSAASLRFGIGRMTTEAEIEEAARRIIEAVHALRDASPAWALKQAGIQLPGR